MKLKDIGWNYDNTYLLLPEVFYAKQWPEPFKNPYWILKNEKLSRHLGLNSENLFTEDGLNLILGKVKKEEMTPISQAYAGHQFGYFTMLGDGRAVLLGEHLTADGKWVDIQLKGSGRTPYSRGGDGKAALGPMLREYIISEAMHGLGIPTSRSLAVIGTGESVHREEKLEGAMIIRVAASHIRVGTFEYAAKWGDLEELQELADYTIRRHYPDLKNLENPYRSLLSQVMQSQAELIAKWMGVGFIHGVMNTDNMTISGETIDYGPCAFMDSYSLNTVFSSIDRQGRYAYGRQPYIGQWNLARFAESLLPLLDEDSETALSFAQGEIEGASEIFRREYFLVMGKKLALVNPSQEDIAVIQELLDLMESTGADYTNTFRALTIGEEESSEMSSVKFDDWLRRWKERLLARGVSMEEAQTQMKKANPSVIPRNHLVESALSAATEQGDFSKIQRFLKVLEDPYSFSSEQDEYSQTPMASEQPYRTFCGT